MSESRAETGSHFARELREQPDAIRASVRAAADGWQSIARAAADVDRVVIVGSGDGFFVTPAVVPAFEVLAGLPAEGIEAYDLVVDRLDAIAARTLVIALSASGKSVRTLQAVELAARRGALTVGVTNNPAGPLAAAARMVLPTSGGTAYSFPTRTTTTAAAVLIGLAATLGEARGTCAPDVGRSVRNELEHALPAAIESVLRSPTADHLADAAAELMPCRHLICVGSGASRAAALIAAAKLHETVRRHALAVNAEEYLHLIGFAASATDGVLVLAPSGAAERERQVAEYASRQGARVFVLVRNGLAEGWRDGAVIPLATDGLRAWSGALVAMAASHLLAERLSHLLGTNPDRPDNVDLDYALGLLYTALLEGW
jgi:glucosamine--fructose-6-phosphate aminotransferase (isomerizing)